MKNHSRFQRGSGVYTCNSCGRKTRETDGDAANVRCCAECYAAAGIENEISDNRNGESPEWLQGRESELKRLQEVIVYKGGRL